VIRRPQDSQEVGMEVGKGKGADDEADVEGRISIDVDEAAVPQAVVFRLEGRLDIFTYMELKQRMEPYLAGSEGKCWLVDLSLVPFVASSGWSVLLGTRSRLKLLHCRLALLGLAPNLARIHQSMNMGILVPAFASLAEARSALKL
jgi:anti-sigma B factor antagonist